MEVFVKSGQEKIDHPSKNPWWRKGLKVAENRQKTMTFESPGQEKDYRKKVDSNPNNIYGLPEFYPPLMIRSYVGERLSEEDWERVFGNHPRWERFIRDMELYCSCCDKLTIHSISKEGSFCRKCGSQTPYHI